MKLSATKTDININKANCSGYSLLELIITIFIMGMILLVVNVVLVATIRTAREADARMKIRQGVESGIEVIRRNLKSGNSNSLEEVRVDVDGNGTADVDGLKVRLPETGREVTFYANNGALKSRWDDGREINLTSTRDLQVTSFEFEFIQDYTSGTAIVLLTIQADSAGIGNSGNPVVVGFVKQAKIVTEGQDV